MAATEEIPTMMKALVKEHETESYNYIIMPVPEPGPTAPPPPMNVFQQKVYGCVLLKTYRDFLSNVARELKALRSVCRRRTPRITVLL